MKNLLAVIAAALSGCAAHKAALSAELEPLRFESAPAPPRILTENHFQRDKPTALGESELKTVLAAPVFLEENARVGVIPVAAGYSVDDGLPTVASPATLVDALESSGLFELASEVSADWPADKGIAGLRELAARYRAEYLVLYRHRFVEQSFLNAWGWSYLTLVAIPFARAHTLETAGVLEATLFDVKTGTILFTVFERVHEQVNETAFGLERRSAEMKKRLLEQAAQKLAAQMVQKCRRLAAVRPQKGGEAVSVAPPN